MDCVRIAAPRDGGPKWLRVCINSLYVDLLGGCMALCDFIRSVKL